MAASLRMMGAAGADFVAGELMFCESERDEGVQCFCSLQFNVLRCESSRVSRPRRQQLTGQQLPGCIYGA
jgi:hypothetical protein